MSDHPSSGRTHSWLRLLGAVLPVATMLVVLVVTWDFRLDEPGWIATVVGAIGLAAVAAVLVIRVPENRVSWLMLVVVYGFGAAVGATYAFGGRIADAVGTLMVFAVVVPGLAIALPLWFPSGRVPTPRWLWVQALAVASTASVVVGTLVVGWVENGDPGSISGCESLGTCAGFVGVVGLILAMIGAIASFVTRWIGSEGVERAQLQWLVPALTVFGVGMGAEFGGFDGSPVANFALPAGLVLIVGAITVALLRYRLYEIGRLLRRSLSYVIVLGSLAALFAAVVVLPTAAIGGDEAPAWLVALGTLMAFALFEPLRRRVQARVDRRFDRARYDAEAVVDEFSEQIRNETELEAVAVGLGTVAGTVFRPESVGIWIPEAGRR